MTKHGRNYLCSWSTILRTETCIISQANVLQRSMIYCKGYFRDNVTEAGRND